MMRKTDSEYKMKGTEKVKGCRDLQKEGDGVIEATLIIALKADGFLECFHCCKCQ